MPPGSADLRVLALHEAQRDEARRRDRLQEPGPPRRGVEAQGLREEGREGVRDLASQGVKKSARGKGEKPLACGLCCA